MEAEYYLAGIILLQFLYIFYSDFASRREREALEVKLMSKDAAEYKTATEKPAENTPQKESEYVDVSEVEVEKLLRAEDNT